MKEDRQEAMLRSLLAGIQTATDKDLHRIMCAVEERYATVYPDWDVVYIAVPKEPRLRRERLNGIVSLLEQDIQWYENKKDSLG